MITASIRFYKRYISPLLPKTCRFEPTCSTYALQAIKQHGVFKGMILATIRIIRCNPWHQCDHHDPVPKAFTWSGLIGYKHCGHTNKKSKANNEPT